MQLEIGEGSFRLRSACGDILRCTAQEPLFYVGRGEESVDMYRGNYKIEDYVSERRPLRFSGAEAAEEGWLLHFGSTLRVHLCCEGGCCTLRPECLESGVNRLWLRVCAGEGEHCWGCGEQMSWFDLRGRHFPIWTSEPGVGRDRSTYVTWRSDVENKAGGDYYNTNYPQPGYVSSAHYYLYAETTAYADFDFRHPGFHELQFWEIPACIRIEEAESYAALLEKQSAFFGRQPMLPDWAREGLIIGLQGGRERTEELLRRTQEHGIKVSAVWCQDWCGKRVTSFGKRLQWDWHYDPALYPDLPGMIEDLHRQGIRFLGYINPYLVEGGALYREGLERGVFARRSDGSVYLVDFGEFDCGVVDLTDPEAFRWFRDRVIRGCSLDIGIDGWMADFGEYLPTDDIVLHSGRPAMIEHNRWPVLWAQCNREALEEAGKLGEALFFMRAGGAGSQGACTLLWAGDQSVDFSRHDGLCTVICAALSAGMSGFGLTHSDIGGYTSLFGNVRSRELFQRWAEMAAFTPVMRTHEGNRPEENFQYYDDAACMESLARLVGIHCALGPLLKELEAENAASGLPVQRPLFLHHEDDPRCLTEQFEYLLGPDVLVAPVWQEAQTERELYLPEGTWVHLWSGREYGQGDCRVSAGEGFPPVFWRKGSRWAPLMEGIRAEYGA